MDQQPSDYDTFAAVGSTAGTPSTSVHVPQAPQTTSATRHTRSFPETERPYLAFVRTTQDALAIIEGARTGVIPAVNRRLSPAERGALIQSGATFVFDERATGIRRWTDGRNWSPSRILGNFLIYRELVREDGGSDEYGIVDAPELRSNDRELVRDVFGSHRDHSQYKRGGFMKRTLSLVLEGTTTHLINYYLPQDALQGTLPQPSVSGPLVDLGRTTRLAQIAQDQLRRTLQPRGSEAGGSSSSSSVQPQGGSVDLEENETTVSAGSSPPPEMG